MRNCSTVNFFVLISSIVMGSACTSSAAAARAAVACKYSVIPQEEVDRNMAAYRAAVGRCSAASGAKQYRLSGAQNADAAIVGENSIYWAYSSIDMLFMREAQLTGNVAYFMSCLTPSCVKKECLIEFPTITDAAALAHARKSEHKAFLHGYLVDVLDKIAAHTALAPFFAEDTSPSSQLQAVLSSLGVGEPNRTFLCCHYWDLILAAVMQRLIQLGNSAEAKRIITFYKNTPETSRGGGAFTFEERMTICGWASWEGDGGDARFRKVHTAPQPVGGMSMYQVIMRSGNEELQKELFSLAVAAKSKGLVASMLHPDTPFVRRNKPREGKTLAVTIAGWQGDSEYVYTVLEHCQRLLRMDIGHRDDQGKTVAYTLAATHPTIVPRVNALARTSGFANAPAGDARYLEAKIRRHWVCAALAAYPHVTVSPEQITPLVRMTFGWSKAQITALIDALIAFIPRETPAKLLDDDLFKAFLASAEYDEQRCTVARSLGADDDIRIHFLSGDPEAAGRRISCLPGLGAPAYAEIASIMREFIGMRERTITESCATPMRGRILMGPYGCGKTRLVKAIAQEVNALIYEPLVPAALFRAITAAGKHKIPVILLLDEMEKFAPAGDAATIKTALESGGSGALGQRIYVLGTTNLPGQIDPGVLGGQGGRLRPFALGFLSSVGRAQVLKYYCDRKGIPLDLAEGETPEEFLHDLSRYCEGIVGRDIEELVSQLATRLQPSDAAPATPLSRELFFEQFDDRESGIAETEASSPEHDVLRRPEYQIARRQRMLARSGIAWPADGVSSVGEVCDELLARAVERSEELFAQRYAHEQAALPGDDFGRTGAPVAAAPASAAALAADVLMERVLIAGDGTTSVDDLVRYFAAQHSEQFCWTELDCASGITTRDFGAVFRLAYERALRECKPCMIHLSSVDAVCVSGMESGFYDALNTWLRMPHSPALFCVATATDATKLHPDMTALWFPRTISLVSRHTDDAQAALCEYLEGTGIPVSARLVAGKPDIATLAELLVGKPPADIRRIVASAASAAQAGSGAAYLDSADLYHAYGAVCSAPVAASLSAQLPFLQVYPLRTISLAERRKHAIVHIDSIWGIPEEIREQLKRFVSFMTEPDGPYIPLALCGNEGSGKTHIARSIASSYGAYLVEIDAQAGDLSREQVPQVVSLLKSAPRPLLLIRHMHPDISDTFVQLMKECFSHEIPLVVTAPKMRALREDVRSSFGDIAVPDATPEDRRNTIFSWLMDWDFESRDPVFTVASSGDHGVSLLYEKTGGFNRKQLANLFERIEKKARILGRLTVGVVNQVRGEC